MLYLTNIDLNQNQLLNAIVQPLATPPSSPKYGQIYCNSATNKVMFYTGEAWQTVGVIVESSSANGQIIVDGVPMTVYTLPKATSDILGGIKVGYGLSVDADGVLRVIDNGHLHEISNVTGLGSALDLKAPIASPEFTGIPTSPTPEWSDRSQQIANTEWVKYSIESIINSVEAHVNAGTVSGDGTIMSINDSILDPQSLTIGSDPINSLSTYDAGWEFRVLSPGTIAGIGPVQSGDWVVCINGTEDGFLASDWTVIQTNIDITTTVVDDDAKVPTSAAIVDYAQPISQRLTELSDEDGVINDYLADMPASTIKGNNRASSGKPLDLTVAQVRSLIGSTQKVTLTNPSITPVGGTATWNISHSLNTTSLIVQVYETATNEQVLADVTINSESSITINWVSEGAISAGMYRVVILG